ncbi:mCG141088, partial [Mus musculus]
QAWMEMADQIPGASSAFWMQGLGCCPLPTRVSSWEYACCDAPPQTGVSRVQLLSLLSPDWPQLDGTCLTNALKFPPSAYPPPGGSWGHCQMQSPCFRVC